MKRPEKTPLALQSHASECGAACLGTILAYYGKWVPLHKLRELCEVSRDGSSAASLKRAAEKFGLKCNGRSIQTRHLAEMPMPMILYWEFNHFVVLEGVANGRYYINDPACGHRILTADEFTAGFTEIVLVFEKGTDFAPGNEKRGIFDHVPEWFRGTSASLCLIALCGLLLAVLGLAIPAAVSIFIDQTFAAGAQWSSASIAIAGAAATALAYLLALLKHRWLKRLSIRLAVIVSDQCVSQLLRKPTEFFNHRLVGDLVFRLLSTDKIADNLTQKLVEFLITMTTRLIYLIVMLAFAPLLGLIVLSLALLNAAVAYATARKGFDLGLVWRREQGLAAGVGTLMLNQAEVMRMTGVGESFLTRLSGYKARELFARQQHLENQKIHLSLENIFTILCNAIVLIFGAYAVINGDLTLGAMVGFYIVASLFMQPVANLAVIHGIRYAIEADMLRLLDILSASGNTADEPQDASSAVSTLDGRLKLTGHVHISNISFGYSGSKPLLKDFSLTIKPGQRVGIVGPSGSGKSTLARLVAGLFEPCSGEIAFDGFSRNTIPSEVLSRSISVVDQKISLFPDTVRDNITLWNPSVPEATIVAAACDACIHEEILNRPLGYNTMVEQGGVNFSGGQKQRMEIARALINNPSILILDEATSSLDAKTENLVDDALRRRGMTCIIIAHRLSTVRDCDQIIVLEKGEEVQRGTHDELMAEQGGIYRQLVQSG